MKEIKVSVIVTIHNAEKYIKECMDSLITQSFDKIEILCMDGGSTDKTPIILQSYAEQDARIRIINDPNTSYGHKVNRGIDEAQGEYIAVLESDDMYETYMIEKLYEIVEQYHPDFVNADYTCFFDVNGYRFKYITQMYQPENYNCLINYREQPERFGVISRFWTGLFSKEFLQREQIRMNESPGASYQDMSFRFLTSVLAEKAYHLNIPVYLYRIDNPGSSMYDSKKSVVIADEHDFLKKELLKRKIENRYVLHNMYSWKYMDFRGNMKHLRGQYQQELFDRYREELEKDRDELSKYMDLKYDQFVLDMITESPERIMELIDTDSRNEETYRCRLQGYLEVITTLSKDVPIVVFGCGVKGRAAWSYIKEMGRSICCFADNSAVKENKQIEGTEVLMPKDAVAKYPNAYYIVANQRHAFEMHKQLERLGVENENIYEFI